MCETCKYKAKVEEKIRVMAKGVSGLRDGEGVGSVIVQCGLHRGKETFARDL